MQYPKLKSRVSAGTGGGGGGGGPDKHSSKFKLEHMASQSTLHVKAPFRFVLARRQYCSHHGLQVPVFASRYSSGFWLLSPPNEKSASLHLVHVVALAQVAQFGVRQGLQKPCASKNRPSRHRAQAVPLQVSHSWSELHRAWGKTKFKRIVRNMPRARAVGPCTLHSSTGRSRLAGVAGSLGCCSEQLPAVSIALTKPSDLQGWPKQVKL